MPTNSIYFFFLEDISRWIYGVGNGGKTFFFLQRIYKELCEITLFLLLAEILSTYYEGFYHLWARKIPYSWRSSTELYKIGPWAFFIIFENILKTKKMNKNR